jgi:hypothetical protein
MRRRHSEEGDGEDRSLESKKRLWGNERREMRPKKNVKTAVALVVLLLLPGVSHALTNQQKALVGLPGLSVAVAIDPHVPASGLTKEQTKTDVELRLRKAGINVVEEGWPILGVGITAMKTNSTTIFYAIEVELSEVVTLHRGIKASGTTWDAGFIGYTGINNAIKIRRDVNDQVDRFINNYLAANPR